MSLKFIFAGLAFLGLILCSCKPGGQSDTTQPDTVQSQDDAPGVVATLPQPALVVTNGFSMTSADDNQADASKLLEELLQAEKNIIELEASTPTSTDNIEIENEKLALLSEQYIDTIWRSALKAREFVSSFPNHEFSDKIKDLEKRWVTQLAGQGFEPAANRLNQIIVNSLDDPAVSLDEKYRILVQAVQMAALRERPNGNLAMAQAFEKGADQLLAKFPSKLLSVELYFIPIRVYHSYKQEDQFTSLHNRIVSMLQSFEADADARVEAAKVRLNYGAALFEIRRSGKAREILTPLLGMDISPEIQNEAQLALDTIKNVLDAETIQDEILGTTLDFSSTTIAGDGTKSTQLLTSLPHKILILIFWNSLDQKTKSTLADAYAVMDRFTRDDPAEVQIIHVPVPAPDGGSPDQLIASINAGPDPILFVDVTSDMNKSAFEKLPLPVLPDVWILDRERKIHSVRSHSSLGSKLLHALRSQP